MILVNGNGERKIVEERVYGQAPAPVPEPEPDPEERIPVTLNVVMADLTDGVEACAKLANEIGAKLFGEAPYECETLQKVLCLSDRLATTVEKIWRVQDYLMMISQRLGM